MSLPYGNELLNHYSLQRLLNICCFDILLEKLPGKESAISRPKWFAVLKLRKNVDHHGNQVPLENIKQRLIYQISKIGLMSYEQSK